MEIKLGSVWVNNDRYEGEGEIIIGKFLGKGWIQCIHANHTKYPVLNGSVEMKHEDDILRYYHKVSD